jgi:hypothetical protein
MVKAEDLIPREDILSELERITAIIKRVVAANPTESRATLHGLCVSAIRNEGTDTIDAFIDHIIAICHRNCHSSPG